jgi:glycerol uptake facilitator-like aquaporin
MFSNTFAGIAPASVPSFIAAQLAGGALAVAVIRVLYPRLTPAQAADILVPHSPRHAPGQNPDGGPGPGTASQERPLP